MMTLTAMASVRYVSQRRTGEIRLRGELATSRPTVHAVYRNTGAATTSDAIDQRIVSGIASTSSCGQVGSVNPRLMSWKRRVPRL